MATTLSFDRNRLRRRVKALPVGSRAAFALACAQRLIAASNDEPTLSGLLDWGRLKSALDVAWRKLSNLEVNDAELAALVSETLDQVPTVESHENAKYGYVAEYAVICLVTALNACLDTNADHAVIAAEEVYVALDAYIIDSREIDAFAPGGENAILADPRMQRELERQSEDLRALEDDHQQLAYVQLRERAVADAGQLFHS